MQAGNTNRKNWLGLNVNLISPQVLDKWKSICKNNPTESLLNYQVGSSNSRFLNRG